MQGFGTRSPASVAARAGRRRCVLRYSMAERKSQRSGCQRQKECRKRDVIKNGSPDLTVGPCRGFTISLEPNPTMAVLKRQRKEQLLRRCLLFVEPWALRTLYLSRTGTGGIRVFTGLIVVVADSVQDRIPGREVSARPVSGVKHNKYPMG